ncbi:hypothetical protein VTN96DRAFT_1046 [Rasamsonia emersonii]
MTLKYKGQFTTSIPPVADVRFEESLFAGYFLYRLEDLTLRNHESHRTTSCLEATYKLPNPTPAILF